MGGIKLKNISKNFTESGQVIAPLSLEIKQGDFVTILGPSGCGKSTLLRLIAQLELPSTGEIHIEDVGRSLFKSFVFQEPQLLPWRSVLSNTALPLELAGVEEEAYTTQARKVLKIVEMENSLHLLPHQLSGGMKMRVSLARALITQPTLLLLDEPFSALDEVIRFKLQEDLYKIWLEQKITVVFVTHSVSEAVFLSNRVLVISQKPGKILLNKEINLGNERNQNLRSQTNYVNLTQELSLFMRQQ